MKLRKNRRGFTIVELVIVVAVIGVLAAVLIPTFVNLTNKANKAADNSLVANLNTALAGREGEADDTKNNTMQDVIDDLEAWGYKLENLTTKSKEKLLWNEKTNRFTLEDKADFEKYSTSNYWKIVKSTSELLKEEGEYYSGYAHTKFSTTEAKNGITVYAGFDAGSVNFSQITYENKSDTAKVVSIRTIGGTLVVGSNEFTAKGQIYHYGIAKDCTIYTETSCFHTAGGIGNMNLKEGKAIAEDGGLVYLVKAAVGVLIEEVGTGKFFIPEETTQAEDGTGVPASVAEQVGITPATSGTSSTYSGATKVGGNVYEIGNLAALEKFRDLVNSGFNFDGISVKLTSDIKLSDGWKPIGEGARRPGYAADGQPWEHTGATFSGVFDGDNHKIIGLNNIGYEPTIINVSTENKGYLYSYGLFGVTSSGATISNLTLEDVDIDTSRENSIHAAGDCVGGLIGFCAGQATITNVKVYGTISANEAVGGLIGRAYNQDGKAQIQTISITNSIIDVDLECTNYHVAGIIGYVSYQNAYVGETKKNCSFNITCTGNTVSGSYVAPKQDASGLFNFSDTANAVNIIVNTNTVDCQITVNTSSNQVKWAAFVTSHSGSTIAFGTGANANVKGEHFTATVNNEDITSTIGEH